MGAGLTDKLLDAGTSIIAASTGLPLTESRTIMEKATYAAIREHGLRRPPTTDDPLPLRHAMVERATELVREALLGRGLPEHTSAQACAEMLALYRSIRPLDRPNQTPPQ